VVLTDWLSITPAEGPGFSASPLPGMLDQQEIDPFPQTLGNRPVMAALHCGGASGW